MGRAKDIIVKVIPSKIANDFVKKNHYSGKVVNNSNLHFGAFLDDRLHGVMSFGSSTSKDKTMKLVEGTGWNEFIELNRMAFDDYLPKNSESRCLGYALRQIKKKAPHIKWVISFADGCQCGDGTIYRASNFVLTGIKKNTGLRKDKNGNVYNAVTIGAHKPQKIEKFKKMEKLAGYMFRYVYFMDEKYKQKLTTPVIPFSKIDDIGAGMYKAQKISLKQRKNAQR